MEYGIKFRAIKPVSPYPIKKWKEHNGLISHYKWLGSHSSLKGRAPNSRNNRIIRQISFVGAGHDPSEKKLEIKIIGVTANNIRELVPLLGLTLHNCFISVYTVVILHKVLYYLFKPPLKLGYS